MPAVIFLFGLLMGSVDFRSRRFAFRGAGGEPPRRMLLRGLTCPAAPAGVYAPSSPINRLLNVYYGMFLKSILKWIHKMIEVTKMLSKNNPIQRDQLEMVTLDQLVPQDHSEVFYNEQGRLS
ncbi:hypothetical protein [Bacillus sp. CECT 9360]|uniref:hypothetical protein n=1 Tax=Bacillus sp. CECT 9360 TaxID=2845821 RepID=UPI001E310966|nr:hypothetical protein [Bacillus sp. CECT 9360]